MTAFFWTLFFQVLAPSGPAHRMAGVDFGEPTRDCAGRGQICRIEELDWKVRWQPEGLGETWVDSNGVLHFSLPVFFWEEKKDSLPRLPLYLFLSLFPAPLQPLHEAPVPGRREMDAFLFEIPSKSGN